MIRNILEGAYTIFSQHFIATPYPITKKLEAIYDIAAFRRPEIRNHQAEEFVNTSFVAELDKNGFIMKLYEQKMTAFADMMVVHRFCFSEYSFRKPAVLSDQISHPCG